MIDVEAVAAVLATPAWPAERCADFFGRYLGAAVADDGGRAVLRAILDAARAAHPGAELQMAQQLCRLADFGEVNDARSPAHRLLSGVLHSSAVPGAVRSAPNGWFGVNVFDLCCIVDRCALPHQERGDFAASVLCALEVQDPACIAAVSPCLLGRDWGSLVLDTNDEMEARTFGLVTSHLSDHARLLLTTSTPNDASQLARACVSFYLRKRGAAPVLTHPSEPRPWLREWTELLLLARRDVPAVFDELVLAVLEKCARTNKGFLRALCMHLGDDTRKQSGDKTTWRLGGITVTHSGKPHLGRWSWTPKKV